MSRIAQVAAGAPLHRDDIDASLLPTGTNHSHPTYQSRAQNSYSEYQTDNKKGMNDLRDRTSLELERLQTEESTLRRLLANIDTKTHQTAKPKFLEDYTTDQSRIKEESTQPPTMTQRLGLRSLVAELRNGSSENIDEAFDAEQRKRYDDGYGRRGTVVATGNALQEDSDSGSRYQVDPERSLLNRTRPLSAAIRGVKRSALSTRPMSASVLRNTRPSTMQEVNDMWTPPELRGRVGRIQMEQRPHSAAPALNQRFGGVGNSSYLNTFTKSSHAIDEAQDRASNISRTSFNVDQYIAQKEGSLVHQANQQDSKPLQCFERPNSAKMMLHRKFQARAKEPTSYLDDALLQDQKASAKERIGGGKANYSYALQQQQATLQALAKKDHQYRKLVDHADEHKVLVHKAMQSIAQFSTSSMGGAKADDFPKDRR